jgi:hypothetical protein
MSIHDVILRTVLVSYSACISMHGINSMNDAAPIDLVIPMYNMSKIIVTTHVSKIQAAVRGSVSGPLLVSASRRVSLSSLSFLSLLVA